MLKKLSPTLLFLWLVVVFPVAAEGIARLRKQESVSLTPKVVMMRNDEYDEDDYDEWRDENYVESTHHQVGGYPDPIQGDEMEEQCLLVSNGVYCGDASGYNSNKAEELKKEKNDWKLLFQIDSDDDLELMWGDCGMLYFWIKESDGKALNFDNVWLVLQCG